MLTRKPFASEPRNGIKESLTDSFQLEMLCLALTMLILALFLGRGVRAAPQMFTVLVSTLIQSRDLNSPPFRRFGLRRRALLGAWTLAAFFAVNEWNSQLLFVFQNLQVDQFGGEELLNTTAQLDDVVEMWEARNEENASVEGGRGTRTRTTASQPSIVCFTDEVSTMFLASEDFNIPLRPLRSSARTTNLSAILRVSR